jgi:hypothetical protein
MYSTEEDERGSGHGLFKRIGKKHGSLNQVSCCPGEEPKKGMFKC